MKSQSCSGPIGCPAPSFMPSSMSSRVANPSSYIRTAAMRYGTRSMFTMKPERSLVRIGRLPICSTNASAIWTVSSAVSSATTISTSFITGTGEKKCRPSTRVGRCVAAARPAIGIEDVFEARITESSSASSSVRNTPRLTPRSSTIASMTSSEPCSEWSSLENVIRSCNASACSASIFPPRTRRRLGDAGPHEPGSDDADLPDLRHAGRRLLPRCLHLPLAQLDAADLARERLGQVVDELDLARIGVCGQPLAHELLDVLDEL